MKLTKKEAIENHRKMWNWIAIMLKSERYKAFDYTGCGFGYGTTVIFLKQAYLNMIGLKGEVYCDCFCCEFAIHQDNQSCDCESCPVVWQNGECNNSEYEQFTRLPCPPENLPKAVELALKIANLPERED